MTSISRVQALFPDLHVVIVGQDGNAYGPQAPSSLPLSQWARDSLSFDPKRTHWLGSLSLSDYYQVIVNSDCHVYLTAPFILSWSLLEVMSAQVPIVASNTPCSRSPYRRPHSTACRFFRCRFSVRRSPVSSRPAWLAHLRLRLGLPLLPTPLNSAKAWSRLLLTVPVLVCTKRHKSIVLFRWARYKCCAGLFCQHTPPPWWVR